MSKFIKGIFVCLAILGYFQYNRVFQPDKEIVLHHYEHCKIVNSTGSFLDFAYYDNDIIVAEDNLMQLFEEGPRGLSNGRLLLIKNTEHADPELQEIIIRNFPSDVGFHPFAIDFIKPNSLYVLNHAFHEGGTRVEIFNLTENTATYFNYFTFDSDLQGIFGDFIVDNDHEAYFTQYSPIPMPLDGGPMPITHYLLNLLSDIFQTANTYVFHCKFESNSTADCVPLPNTQSVSSTGITKNKFGDYYITYGSIDYN